MFSLKPKVQYLPAVNGAGMGVWEWNLETGKVIWEACCCKIFGYPNNDDIPNDFHDFNKIIVEEDLQNLMTEIDAGLKEAGRFSVQYRINRRDGGIAWVLSAGEAIQYRDKKPIRLTGSLTDITKQKNAEVESRNYQSRLANIMENIADSLIALSSDGVIEHYNKASETIFGYTPAEAIGQKVSMLLPIQYSDRMGEMIEYLTSREINREIIGQRKNGEIFPMLISVAEVKGENGKTFSCIVRDITQAKRSEYELKRSNQELEQFAYIASHDLKAPLRSIDNLAKWVIEDTGPALPQDAQDKLEMLRGRVGRLEKLLDDILSYSRAGRQQETIEEIDVQRLVENLAQTHLPPGFELKIMTDLPVLKAARAPLNQIFGNIFSNSVKHHDKGRGIIEVSSEENEYHYIFTVKDDGPGIPAEFHSRVFQMFQTLQPRDKVDGSGLGMAIIKKLIEYQGGKVSIRSEDGQRGTAIIFTWPRDLSSGVSF